jgi:hypothetical protein
MYSKTQNPERAHCPASTHVLSSYCELVRYNCRRDSARKNSVIKDSPPLPPSPASLLFPLSATGSKDDRPRDERAGPLLFDDNYCQYKAASEVSKLAHTWRYLFAGENKRKRNATATPGQECPSLLLVYQEICSRFLIPVLLMMKK